MAVSSAIPVFSPALPDTVWRASQLGMHRAATVATGYSALDDELPGNGWPSMGLTELLLPHTGIGEMRLLAPALATLTRNGKSIVLLAPPHVPLAAAFTQLGLNLRRLLVVDAGKPNDRVWAAEQILKSGSFGALLCWLPQIQPEQIRRLQIAASSNEGLAFMFRPLKTEAHPSPAPLRLTCQPAPSGHIALQVIKRRGPAHTKPLLVSLPLHPVLAKAFADRTDLSSSSGSFPDVVDRYSSSAVAARRRTTLLV